MSSGQRIIDGMKEAVAMMKRHHKRVLVCGGRNFANKHLVYTTLDNLHATFGPFECVIEGGARGADHFAAIWSVRENIAERLKFQADWSTYGLAAGPRRNQIMIDEGKPDLVVAFSGGRGTADMVSRARKAGITVVHVPERAGG